MLQSLVSPCQRVTLGKRIHHLVEEKRYRRRNRKDDKENSPYHRHAFLCRRLSSCGPKQQSLPALTLLIGFFCWVCGIHEVRLQVLCPYITIFPLFQGHRSLPQPRQTEVSLSRKNGINSERGNGFLNSWNVRQLTLVCI